MTTSVISSADTRLVWASPVVMPLTTRVSTHGSTSRTTSPRARPRARSVAKPSSVGLMNCCQVSRNSSRLLSSLDGQAGHALHVGGQAHVVDVLADEVPQVLPGRARVGQRQVGGQAEQRVPHQQDLRVPHPVDQDPVRAGPLGHGVDGQRRVADLGEHVERGVDDRLALLEVRRTARSTAAGAVACLGRCRGRRLARRCRGHRRQATAGTPMASDERVEVPCPPWRPPTYDIRPMLEMRGTCERCDASLLPDGPATICSFECTFCPGCAAAMDHTCPNCGGELVTRPRRASG